MNKATESLFSHFLFLGNPEFKAIPKTQWIRNQIAGDFFEIANNALQIDNLERDKLIYLCGLLHKSAVIQYEMGAKDRGVELFKQMLQIYSRIPSPLRDLDGLTAQVVDAKKAIGEAEMARNGPDAGISIWMQTWSEWYSRGEEWQRKSGITMRSLLFLGQRLIDSLARAERWDDLRRIEPQFQAAERIYREITEK